jgi:glycosyltransferase involved in cell wall biosynthesis
MPIFSVVIPTHNRVHLIERAISSVLAQTCTDFELIVVDDGSSDDTKTVVERTGDPRIRYVYQQNAGAAAARNHGARLATGEYLTFLDSDDEALPSWLERLGRGFLEEKTEIVCCGLEKVGHGPEVEQRGGVLLPRDMGPMFDHAVGRFTNGGVYAMRRWIFDQVGGFVDELRSGQHTELAMRMVPLAGREGWRIHNIMEPLVRVHVHGGPRIRGNPESIFAGSSYTLRVHRDLFRRDPRLHAKYHAIAGVNAIRIGQYAESRHHFAQAVRLDPARLEHWGRLLLAAVPILARSKWSRTGSGDR